MLTAVERPPLIATLRHLPARLEALTGHLTDTQLDAHQPGEWSTRQNIHHLADSHIHGFIRTKQALTEDRPTVKPYDQDTWANLLDGRDLPVAYSLAILAGMHARWAALLESLTEEQWARSVAHPERGVMTVADLLVMYARHGESHIKQFQETLARLS